MKPSTLIPLLVATAVTAFALARWTGPDAGTITEQPDASPRRALARAGAGQRTPESPAREIGKYPEAFKGMTAKKAAALSSGERMALLEQGVLLVDWGNQAAVLCGLIGGLHKNELADATKILLDALQTGNGQPDVVWQSLWQQWGRLDPEGAFSRFADFNPGDSDNCARNIMSGWL